MAYEAKVLADSISQKDYRLTTMQVTLPRFVLAEYNTHRAFSRNSASSRAIPVEKQIIRVLEDPAMPVFWGANQPGMKARSELLNDDKLVAMEQWLRQRDFAVLGAVALNGGIERLHDEGLKEKLIDLGASYPVIDTAHLIEPAHKQIVNRLLEPFMWQTILTTATDWDNFFALRTHPDAQPEIQHASILMKQSYEESQPDFKGENDWHLPLIQADEQEWAKEHLNQAIKVAIGRCARVSYLTHDGKRDLQKDIELHDSLLEAGHMSPFEHVAMPMKQEELANGQLYSGNFRGWKQYRKTIPYENDYQVAQEMRAKKLLEEEGIVVES